jgi:uncharacterized membrane protein
VDELVKKIEFWVQKRIISVRTARKILAAEGLHAEDVLQISSGGKLVSVIATLGAILVALGVLLFIGSNWQAIGVVAKISIIIASIVITYASGYYMQFGRANYKRIGYALMLLGSILYGAGLFLVSQLFHTNANPSTLILIWGAGIFPLALYLRNESIFVLTVILSGIWSFFVSFGDGIFGVLFFGDFAPIVNYPFLIVLASLFASSIFFNFRNGFVLTLIAFLAWFGNMFATWALLADTEEVALLIVATLMYLFWGIVFVFVGRIFDNVARMRLFAFGTRLVGGAALLVSTYILSFNEALYLFKTQVMMTNTMTAVFFGLVALVVFLGVLQFVFAKKPETKQIIIREAGVLLLIAILGVIFFFVPVKAPGRDLFYVFHSTFHPFILPWNFALLAINILLIILGYLERRHVLVNLGMLFFVIHVVTRYFDIIALEFQSYLSFIFGGILLIGLAISLERFRRRLIRKIDAHEQEARPPAITSDTPMPPNTRS